MFNKLIILFSLAIIVGISAGCARKTVVPIEGELVFQASGSPSDVARMALDKLQLQLVDLTGRDKTVLGDYTGTLIGAGGMLLERSGLLETEKFTMSSFRVFSTAGAGEMPYRNELDLYFKAAGQRGLLMAAISDEVTDWRGEVSALNEGTLAYFAIRLDGVRFYAGLINSVADPEALEDFCRTHLGVSGARIASAVSGVWRFQVWEEKNADGIGQVYWCISTPDEDGVLFRTARNLDLNKGIWGRGEKIWLDNGRFGFGSEVPPGINQARMTNLMRVGAPTQLDGAGVWLIKHGAYQRIQNQFFSGVNMPLAQMAQNSKWWIDKLEHSEVGLLQKTPNAIRLVSYSSNSTAQDMLLSQITLPMWFLSGKVWSTLVNAAYADEQVKLDAECERRMKEFYGKMCQYAQVHDGKFSDLNGRLGLEQMGLSGEEYFYFGGGSPADEPVRPILIDRQTEHGLKDRMFFVLFSDGVVRRFNYWRAAPKSKLLISVMHTILRFDEKLFAELIKRADVIDREE